MVYKFADLVKVGMAKNRLEEIRLSREMTRDKLAELSGTTGTTIYRLERGLRKLTDDWKERLAPILQVSPAELIAETATIPVIGTIGAGSEVFISPDFQHLFEPSMLAGQEARYRAGGAEVKKVKQTELLRGLEGLARESFEVVGDDNHPYYRDGDRVFINSSKKGMPDQFIGQECIVKLEGGGVLICSELLNGTFGTYNLTLYNSPPRRNVRIEWAAPVYGKIRTPKEK